MNNKAIEELVAPEPTRRKAGEPETNNSPGTVYESGRRRREEILEAATGLFSEHGYNGVSMRDVASATGVTHAGLRYHFPSKEELLNAVLERYSDEGDEYYDRAVEYLNQTPPDVWGVIGEFTRYLRFTLEHRMRAQMFILHAVLAADPDHSAHDFFDRRYELIRTQFTQVIEHLQQRGFMREELEPRANATALIATVDGLQLQWMIAPNALKYRPIVEESVRRLLRPEHHEKYDQVIADLEMPDDN